MSESGAFSARGAVRAALLLAAACLLVPVAIAGEVSAWLKAADHFRLDAGSSRLEIEVASYRDERLDQTRRYTVFTRPDRRSLVLMKSPAEAGQKMLMLGDNYWLFLPDSQRPLRISPLQKLLGEASTGDIATMTWSEDYTGRLLGEADCEGRRCLKLELVAKRAGQSYVRIELFLARDNQAPLRAELYLDSGKRAKSATFELRGEGGRARVVSMRLRDGIQTGRHTVVRYLDVAPRELSDDWFHPAALARAVPPGE